MSPALTVVIPSRDRRERLAETLAALVGQRGVAGGVAVVVIDDGSRDGTRELLRRPEVLPGNRPARSLLVCLTLWFGGTLVDLLAIQQEIHPGLFAVMDGTTAGDGPGPRTMRPVIKNVMLAAADQVAIDAVAATNISWKKKSEPTDA